MSKIGDLLKVIGVLAEVLPKVVGIFSKSKNAVQNSRAGETFAEDDAEGVAEGGAEGGVGDDAGKRTKNRKSVKKSGSNPRGIITPSENKGIAGER